MLFVCDSSVVLDAIQLRRTRHVYFSHHNLDFHRFHLVGEDLPKHLGILVRQATGVDVFSAVLIALEFRIAHTSTATDQIRLYLPTPPNAIRSYISDTLRKVELAFSATSATPPSYSTAARLRPREIPLRGSQRDLALAAQDSRTFRA